MGCQRSKLQKKIDECTDKDNIKPIMTVYQNQDKSTNKGKHKQTNKLSNENVKKKRKNPAWDDSKSKRSVNSNNSLKKKQRKKNTENLNDKKYDPRLLAKYDIRGVIGKGSYSRVYRVINRHSKQPYAIKIINEVEGYETFEAELTIITRINHANVVKLIEVFESQKHIYMVMELATGGNLLDRLEVLGNFNEDDAAKTLRMIINGIRYLHSLGITHRDLKPDNLLYYHPGRDSRLMITDFGLASTRKHHNNPYMHTVCGTPQYLSPEIILRKPYTCSVDMWAIGVIMYIVLVGAFPFDADKDSLIFKLILNDKINFNNQFWNEISFEGKDFLQRLLNKDPHLRLTAEEALLHLWFNNKSFASHSRSDRGSFSQVSQCSSSSRRSSVRSLHSRHRRVLPNQIDSFLDEFLSGSLSQGSC